MVPVLENYRLTGLLLTAIILYAVFYKGLRTGNPVTMVLVMAFALIPVAGVADQAVVGWLSVTIAVGVLTEAWSRVSPMPSFPIRRVR